MLCKDLGSLTSTDLCPCEWLKTESLLKPSAVINIQRFANFFSTRVWCQQWLEHFQFLKPYYSITESQNLCDFKPGSENLRLAANRYTQSLPGDSLNLSCNSAIWNHLSLGNPTVKCVWVRSKENGTKQAYWDTTDFQRNFCRGKCLTSTVI